jgi:hypothetical protein
VHALHGALLRAWIKCGEELPACSRCVTAGWQCPGYRQRWTFTSENLRLADYYRKKRYVYEEIEPWARVASPETDIESDLRRREIVGARLIKFEGPGQRVCTYASVSSGNDTLVSQLLYYMVNSKSQALLPLQTYGTFFQFIPSRLGCNQALDSAVSCLCGTFSDSLREVRDPSRHVLRQYSQGLRSLRACLDDSDLRFQAETLCASIILHLCEV